MQMETGLPPSRPATPATSGTTGPIASASTGPTGPTAGATPDPSRPGGPSGPAPRASTGPNTGGDWAAQTADKIEEVVGKVRAKTADPIVNIARLLVFGLIAAAVGGMALVLLTIAGVRALDELLPQEVWLAYFVLGAIFAAAGLFLWSKKTPRTDAR